MSNDQTTATAIRDLTIAIARYEAPADAHAAGYTQHAGPARTHREAWARTATDIAQDWQRKYAGWGPATSNTRRAWSHDSAGIEVPAELRAFAQDFRPVCLAMDVWSHSAPDTAGGAGERTIPTTYFLRGADRVSAVTMQQAAEAAAMAYLDLDACRAMDYLLLMQGMELHFALTTLRPIRDFLEGIDGASEHDQAAWVANLLYAVQAVGFEAESDLVASLIDYAFDNDIAFDDLDADAERRNRDWEPNTPDDAA